MLEKINLEADKELDMYKKFNGFKDLLSRKNTDHGEVRQVRFSLKYKILLVLSVLPIIAVTLVVVSAAKSFSDDKVSYIYGSSLSTARSQASSVSSLILASVNTIKGVTANYDPKNKKLTRSGKDYFFNEKTLKLFAVYQNSGEKSFEVTKMGVSPMDDNQISEVIEKAFGRGMAVSPIGKGEYSYGLAVKVGTEVAFGIIENRDLFSLFSSKGARKSLLLHTSMGVIAGGNLSKEWEQVLLSQVKGLDVSVITQEIKVGEQEVLSSFVKLSLDKLYVVSLVDKKVALSAVRSMIERSIVFAIALLSFLMIIGIVVSGKLTYTLRELASATGQIMKGDFDVKIKAQSKDEIGSLAVSFNHMAEEVSRLLVATAEGARMEAELQTAKTVQDTLFPPSKALVGDIAIYGASQPATECGGDWWHYSSIGDGKVFLWIADATGHGAPAALLTSAARAGASVIEDYPDITPAKAMTILNKAIHDTSKGKMMMTFFVACIDYKKGKMTYSNASHDPPYLLSHEIEGAPKRKDFEPLMDANNPRLGEKTGVVYTETEIDISRGDKLVLYTDGILDVKNKEDKIWGERKFMKSLSVINDKLSLGDTVIEIFQKVEDFRQDVPLDDDITLVLVEYKKSA